MSDKRITPEEDYLDSLLRSITSGGEEELDDNFIAEDMDFDSEVNGGMSEEEFLSDFEKEFFGADIDSASVAMDAGKLDEPTLFDEPEMSVESLMFQEPEINTSAELPTDDKTVFRAEDTKESEILAEPDISVEPEISLDTFADVEQPEAAVEEVLFDEPAEEAEAKPADRPVVKDWDFGCPDDVRKN